MARLISTRDLYFSCVRWSSGAVAVGVALEGPEVVHEVRNVLRHLKTEVRPWVTLLALIGWILVALGVIGESISEALVSRADGNIQAFNDQRVADAIKQAGDAKSSAKSAADASRSANDSASDAIRKTGDVKVMVDALGIRAAALDNQLASVQRGLTLRLGRESVLIAKRVSFENTLKPFAGQKVDIRYAANLQNPNNPYDPETYDFAFELHFNLLQAHWRSPGILRQPPAENPSATGVFILVSAMSSKATRNAAVVLANALVSVPIEVRQASKESGLSPGSLVSVWPSVRPYPPRLPQPEAALFPPMDDETIIIEVDPHP